MLHDFGTSSSIGTVDIHNLCQKVSLSVVDIDICLKSIMLQISEPNAHFATSTGSTKAQRSSESASPTWHDSKSGSGEASRAWETVNFELCEPQRLKEACEACEACVFSQGGPPCFSLAPRYRWVSLSRDAKTQGSEGHATPQGGWSPRCSSCYTPGYTKRPIQHRTNLSVGQRNSSKFDADRRATLRGSFCPSRPMKDRTLVVGSFCKRM